MRRSVVAVLAGIFFLPGLGLLPPAAAQSQSTPPKNTPAQHSPAKQKTTTGSAAKKKKRKPVSPRVRRVRQAFVASASLRPMAQQLLQDRTPTAYSGVEAYARRHSKRMREHSPGSSLATRVPSITTTRKPSTRSTGPRLERVNLETTLHITWALLPEHRAQPGGSVHPRRFQ